MAPNDRSTRHTEVNHFRFCMSTPSVGGLNRKNRGNNRAVIVLSARPLSVSSVTSVTSCSDLLQTHIQFLDESVEGFLFHDQGRHDGEHVPSPPGFAEK